jgi:hypothetical protein
MSASAFAVYNKAKKYIGNGTVVLGTTACKMKLCTSASNASTYTLSTFASVTSEISARGGYAAGGRALAGQVWTVGASAKQYKWSFTNLVFTANGSPLNNVKFAIIGVSRGKCICWSKLSTAQFTIATGNTLTVQFNAAGVFTLA